MDAAVVAPWQVYEPLSLEVLSSHHVAWEPDSLPSLWNIAADWRCAGGGCWDVISIGFSPVTACVFSLHFLWDS